MISDTFPICPWCNEECGYQFDAISTTNCEKCKKPFLSICRIEIIKIQWANDPNKEPYEHHERHYETRKIVSEDIYDKSWG